MQTRVLIAAVLFAVWSAGLSYLVWNAALTHAAGRERDLMAKQLDQVLDAQKDAAERAEKLQKTLDRLPKSEGKVREAVKANPAGCDRPAAVSSRVREAAREANRAREMPSDF